MKALLATLRLDVKLQHKNKLYAIGLGVALLLGLALRFLIPQEWLGRALPAFFQMGLGATTFMFAASMVLLERSERTLQALRVSPLTSALYVHSKLLTLVAFAILESLLIFAFASQGVVINMFYLLLGMAVLGGFYVYLGLILVAPFSSVTKFLLPTGTVAALITQLPALSVLEVGSKYLWWCIPTQAPLLLMRAAFEPISTQEWAYALGVSIVGLIVLGLVCVRRCADALGLARGGRA